MKLIIGADIAPTKSNFDLFSNGNVEALIGRKLMNLLSEADFISFNLEVPLVEIPAPIKKNGPNLIAPTSTIAGLVKINPHFFTLANNHILDQGNEGIYSTIKELNKRKIKYCGVGDSLKEASKPYIFDKKGIKVGIYCCTENEFSIATENSVGANPFDPLESLDHICRLKARCDYVIVLYHGGKEHYRYPSPYLQKVCRKIAEKGADLVICQHSHCIGCEELYADSTIVYGQGNFLFDYSNNEYWKTGLLIEVNISDNRPEKRISYIPITRYKNGVRIADPDSSDNILKDFKQRSEEIKYPGKVNELYIQFVKENMWIYYKAFSGGFLNNIIYRICNKMTKYSLDKKILVDKYGHLERIIIKNYIECEAHRELILKGLDLDNE